MKKLLLVVVILSLLVVGAFADTTAGVGVNKDTNPSTTYNGVEFWSNQNVEIKNVKIGVQVYQWIFANATGTNLIIKNPGEFKTDLVTLQVASNAGVSVDTELKNIPSDLELKSLTLYFGENAVSNARGTSATSKLTGTKFLSTEVAPTVVNGKVTTHLLTLGSVFNVLPTLKAAQNGNTDNPAYEMSVDFTFIPNVKF